MSQRPWPAGRYFRPPISFWPSPLLKPQSQTSITRRHLDVVSSAMLAQGSRQLVQGLLDSPTARAVLGIHDHHIHIAAGHKEACRLGPFGKHA